MSALPAAEPAGDLLVVSDLSVHFPLRRATLLRALALYQQRFALPNGRVPASFEIITLTAWAPHESQQQPLQPGTATMRLADALGTVEQPLPRRR